MIGFWRAAIERFGTTDEEIADSWPGDDLVAHADRELFRAVTVDAPPPVVYRRLCQMRVAPYSYDWIDNFGHRSPRELIPGLDDLAVGQRWLIFTLTGFEPDHFITLSADHPLLGELSITYRVESHRRGSRLAVKIRVRFPSGPLGWVTRYVLPAGDLVMMHKQLNNFAELAVADVTAAV